MPWSSTIQIWSASISRTESTFKCQPFSGSHCVCRACRTSVSQACRPSDVLSSSRCVVRPQKSSISTSVNHSACTVDAVCMSSAGFFSTSMQTKRSLGSLGLCILTGTASFRLAWRGSKRHRRHWRPRTLCALHRPRPRLCRLRLPMHGPVPVSHRVRASIPLPRPTLCTFYDTMTRIDK